MHRNRTTPLAIAAALSIGLALSACTGTTTPGASPSTAPVSAAASPSPSPEKATGTVVLVTHDSFAVDKATLKAFEQASGLTVKQVAPGDGGVLVNQLILTKEHPLGDVVFGVDNTFAGRAVSAGVFEPYTSTVPAAADAAAMAPDQTGTLTAVDYGDVCVNVDHTWFAKKKLAEPATFADLADPRYKDLLVVPSAATSSPGFAFLLATVGAFGVDGWKDYWTSLVANGVKVDEGWSDAYYTDFTAGGGDGVRPIVLSYASSPPFTVPEGGTRPTTGALLGTCFRQVEYAGVLAGAKNPAGARALVDFLLSPAVQGQIPEQMYMYPVAKGTALPAEWVEWAPLATTPNVVAPADIAAHRDEWIRDWSQIAVG